VFDEATSSLDARTEADLAATIDALRGVKTMIIIAHRLSTVRSCDTLVWLRDGRVAGHGSFEVLMRVSSEFRQFAAFAAV
jgi:ABC-type multidrug transport system fused ATPase/permease subunit